MESASSSKGAGARKGDRRGPVCWAAGAGRVWRQSQAICISYFEDVYSLEGAERIEWARRAEAAALAADPRITNSDGGSFDVSTGRKALANSRGFVGSYRTSYAGVSAAPLAIDADGKMQRDGWWSSATAARGSGIARGRGQGSGTAHTAPAGSTACSHAARPHRVCAGDGADADRFGL